MKGIAIHKEQEPGVPDDAVLGGPSEQHRGALSREWVTKEPPLHALAGAAPDARQAVWKAQLVLSSADFAGVLTMSSAHSAAILSSAQRCPGSDTSASGIAWRIP